MRSNSKESSRIRILLLIRPTSFQRVRVIETPLTLFGMRKRQSTVATLTGQKIFILTMKQRTTVAKMVNMTLARKRLLGTL
ncbi:hypothetical protein D3C76_1352370 [compost metagenome]